MTPAEFFEGLVAADAHQGGLRCLRLLRIEPAFFAALREEARGICAEEAGSVVGQADHVTHWTRPRGEVRQFSLLNATGRFDDFSSDHDLSCFSKRFWAGDRYPALAELIAAFPSAINLRINLLGPGARLSAHEEQLLFPTRSGGVGVRLRRHLPLVTNPAAEIVLDGEAHHLEPGIVHLVNQGCVHTARNLGGQTRLHLVWDVLLTATDFEMMFGASPLPIPATRLSPADRRPAALRIERMGAFTTLPPAVAEDAVGRVDWCDPQ